MSSARLALLSSAALLCFAANSLLCRAALSETSIDPASFTAIRLVAGAVTLIMLCRLRTARSVSKGSWRSAFALFVYAAAFSYAYTQLPTGTGALLLFGSVQATMLGYGVSRGERPNRPQWIGYGVAIAGLLVLLMPGLSAPPALGAALMMVSGMAWGAYSLGGRGVADATRETAGNFVRSVPFAAGLFLAGLPWLSLDLTGVLYAVTSGAIASGMGYAIWYAALRTLDATRAATLQLSVPAIAAAGGVVLLGEVFTLRLLFASIAILGGIALVVIPRRARS